MDSNSAGPQGPQEIPVAGGSLGRKKITTEQVRGRLETYITGERQGLKRFYDPKDFERVLEKPVKNGVEMAKKLMNLDNPCKREAALSLCLLTLYDLVILVGMSILVYCFIYSRHATDHPVSVENGD
jgi:hypothetical protein